MGKLQRIKRRTLRQAVQENVDVMAGRLPRRRSRWSGVLIKASRIFFFVGLPLALFASSYFLSSFAAAWVDASRTASAATIAGMPGDGAGEDPNAWQELRLAGRTFPAPRPIDQAVLPLTVRRVVIDPGHGADDEGTTAPRGLVEKEITLDLGHRVRELLEAASFEVVMTRDEDEELTLEERAELANRAEGDIFISIHVNWIETRSRGVETYFLGPTEDPFLTRLAARENRDSGYTLADFRSMLERVYADVRQDESRDLAGAVQGSLYRSLRRVNPEIENRGVKTAPFAVLVRTEMPAILAEVSCLSNEREAELLGQSHYRDYIAKALVDGIRAYADALIQTPERGS